MTKGFFKILLLTTLLVMKSYALEQKVVEGAENATPKELNDIGIKENLGAKIDTSLKFVDENGKSVVLADFFKSGDPVLLDLAYYSCPGLCNYHLNALGEAFKGSKLVAGKDYQWVVVSFDTNDKPNVAQAKKKNMIAAYGTVGLEREANEGWHFLTGDKQNIDALAKQVGFSYKWVPEEKQYAHASSAYVVTPDAKISRYLKGVQFDPQTLKLSLMEAHTGGISSVVDSLILYCFHYDAKASKYSLAVMNIARIAGALTALLLFFVIAPNILKQRRGEK